MTDPYSQMARAFLYRNPSSRKARFGHETITPTSSLTDEQCRALAEYAKTVSPEQLAPEDPRSLAVERQLRRNCKPNAGADTASTTKKRTAEAATFAPSTQSAVKRTRRDVDDGDDEDAMAAAPIFTPPSTVGVTAQRSSTGYQPPSHAPARNPRIHTPQVRAPPQLEMGSITGQTGASSFNPFVVGHVASARAPQAQLESLYPFASTSAATGRFQGTGAGTAAFTGTGNVLSSGNVVASQPQPPPQSMSAAQALARIRKRAQTGPSDEEWCKSLRPQSFVIPSTASSKGKKACDTTAIQPRRGKVFTTDLQNRTATTFYHELLRYMNPHAESISTTIVEAIIKAQEARLVDYGHNFTWHLIVLGLVNHYWHGSKEWYYDDEDKYILGKILSCNYEHLGPQENINFSDIFKNKNTALRFMEKFAVQENVGGFTLCVVDENHLSSFMDTILRYNRDTLIQAYSRYTKARQSRISKQN